MGVLIPELVTKYGKGKLVELAFKMINKPSVVKFSKDNARADFNIGITVSVEGSEAIYAEFNAAAAAAKINTVKGTFFGDFNTHTAGTIDASSFRTKISGMTAASLNTHIQSVIEANIP